MRVIKKIIKFMNNRVFKGSIELFLIIVSIFVVSYAWFIESEGNKTKDLTLKTKASRLLYISMDDGETWDVEFNLELDNNFKFSNDVTSDGVNFYKAETKREDGIPITFKEAVAGSDYLEFDILFQSNAPLAVFLDSDSHVIPSCSTEIDDLVGELALKKSTYGNFSRDLIAGALRISFTENSYIDDEYISNANPSLVWAPNKNYELIYNNGVYSFDLNSTNNQDYRYIDPNNGHQYKYISNFKDNLNTDFENDYANGDPMITKIDPSYNNGIKSVTVRIWVEGNDRETHDALTGGSFKLSINFMGILKENNDRVPDVSIQDNTILNFDIDMEYSKDFANNWIKYDEENIPTFSSGDIVYVRYSESDNYYASNYVQLNF